MLLFDDTVGHICFGLISEIYLEYGDSISIILKLTKFMLRVYIFEETIKGWKNDFFPPKKTTSIQMFITNKTHNIK